MINIKELKQLCNEKMNEIESFDRVWYANDVNSEQFKTTYSGATLEYEYEYYFAKNILEEIEDYEFYSNINGAALAAHMKKYIKEYIKELEDMSKEAANEYYNKENEKYEEFKDDEDYSEYKDEYELRDYIRDYELSYTYEKENFEELASLVDNSDFVYDMSRLTK